jgi:hypothetical protein
MPLDARVAWLESDVDTVEADLVRELKTVRDEVGSLKRWAVTIVVTLIGVMGGLFANLLR